MHPKKYFKYSNMTVLSLNLKLFSFTLLGNVYNGTVILNVRNNACHYFRHHVFILKGKHGYYLHDEQFRMSTEQAALCGTISTVIASTYFPRMSPSLNFKKSLLSRTILVPLYSGRRTLPPTSTPTSWISPPTLCVHGWSHSPYCYLQYFLSKLF